MAAISSATSMLSSSKLFSSPSAHRVTPHLYYTTYSFHRLPNYRACRAVVVNDHDQPAIDTTRRTANYQPSLWDYNSMQSLTNGFDEKEYKEEIEKMKEDVKAMIEANEEISLGKIELIDVVQRLGLQYHFEAEIKHALLDVYERTKDCDRFSGNLHATALLFRLMRQHCYSVPQDAFKSFMNESGCFRETLREDVEGLLSLYEASFYGLKGETIVDKAGEFSSRCLRKTMEKGKLPGRLARKVDHALELPIHWRLNRLEARWFIDVYEEEPYKNLTLLRLAKLDYNVVQSIYMEEVGEVSRWWLELGMSKMNFFRDRLLENYLWSLFMVFEPKYRAARVMNAKIATMITLIDDVYDVYGLLEELELLTDFMIRWDITEIDKLPPAIRTCFLALYNTTNEIGHWAMIEWGVNLIPCLWQAWADQCKAYLVEAKWYHKGLKPRTLTEYLDTAVGTTGGLIMLLWCFIATTDVLTEEKLTSISRIHRVTLNSSLILRLINDLSTSKYELARGDNLKSVECYMNETGHSEEVARRHIEELVFETWKTMNEDMLDDNCPVSGLSMSSCLNMARLSHCFYQYGDGYALSDRETKEYLTSVLIRPVPMD